MPCVAQLIAKNQGPIFLGEGSAAHVATPEKAAHRKNEIHYEIRTIKRPVLGGLSAGTLRVPPTYEAANYANLSDCE